LQLTSTQEIGGHTCDDRRDALFFATKLRFSDCLAGKEQLEQSVTMFSGLEVVKHS